MLIFTKIFLKIFLQKIYQIILIILFFTIPQIVYSEECDELTLARMIKSGISDEIIQKHCGGSPQSKNDQKKKIEKEEVDIKNNEKKIADIPEKKINRDNYKFTLRSILFVNTLDYKISNDKGLGFAIESSSTLNEDETVTTNAQSYSIYGLYFLNGCYYCDSSGIFSALGTGKLEFKTKKSSTYNYSVNYLNLSYAYQWYWETDISLVLAGGLIYRSISKTSEEKISGDDTKTDFIKKNTKTGFDFYPIVVVGYSF